jgi:hypothetical protein
LDKQNCCKNVEMKNNKKFSLPLFTTPHPDFIGELPYQGANFSPDRGSVTK